MRIGSSMSDIFVFYSPNIISPEDWNSKPSYSQRYVPMLLWRVLVALGFAHFERLNQLFGRIAGLDHSVHISTFGCNIWIGEAVAEFFDLLFSELLAPNRALSF